MTRTALVTGGNRGIGLATARRLAADGHRVAITYRTTPPDDLAGITAVRCDVTDPDAVDAAVAEVSETLGPIEILVANAGMTKDGLTLRMSDDDFTSVLDTNLAGSFRVARACVRKMMRGRWGRIVFVSSVVGLGGQAGQANYAASKAGLIGLARSLAREFASRGITVNVVAPGPIETDMLDALGSDVQASIVDAVPLGRIGHPDEVAGLMAYLTSEEAGFITGAVIPIDGGLAMGA